MLPHGSGSNIGFFLKGGGGQPRVIVFLLSLNLHAVVVTSHKTGSFLVYILYMYDRPGCYIKRDFHKKHPRRGIPEFKKESYRGVVIGPRLTNLLNRILSSRPVGILAMR